MPHYPAPDIRNYTFGAHELLLGPDPGVSVGNVVTGTITMSPEYAQRFSALFGGPVTDYALAVGLDISVDVTLDEPTQDNLRMFFLADNMGKVGLNPSKISRVIFKGIPVVGNMFTWTIPKAAVTPEGSFGYTSDDWSSFSLRINLIYDVDSPDPYGTVVHDGVTA